MSPRRSQFKSLLVFCGLLVLLGTLILFRENIARNPTIDSGAPKTTVVLHDERQTLGAGTWHETTVDVPFRSLLKVSLRVTSGQPIDVKLSTETS